jgi:eukaryotic-like serine/threonine-protein kinase
MARMQQIEALFHEALALPEGEDRIQWLDRRCQSDPELFTEVSTLLKSHAEMSASEGEEPEPEPVLPAGQYGAYRPVKLIGRGGMSVVYLAERTDGQFQHTAALKVMGAHLAGPEFLRRFQTEKQVLATLHHPNITGLLDGGVSSAGDPYLVMEYVDGQHLDRYCDHHRLSVEARLRLFLQACDAVAYAHRLLIVHRDLKPSNILVAASESGGPGQLKLLDFGTASLLAENCDATVTGMRMLTPRYASPEQLRGERANTSSDVFSLGVILYELLTGAWPFGKETSIVSELHRAVADIPVKALFTAITEETAESRSVSVDHLKRQLRGDLSAIVLKALESDPARRYGTVRQFADDITAYLDGRPVQARPQTALYHARKFLRRRWLPVTAAAGVTLALGISTIVAVHQARVARDQAERAKHISEFAKNTFLSASSVWSSPLRGKSTVINFHDILENATERVGQELKGDPVAEADLRGTLGSTYAVLGDPVKGEAQLRLAIHELEHTPEKVSHLAADLQLLLCNAESYQGRYAEALVSCREGLRLAKASAPTPNLASIMHDTAFMAVKSGAPFDEAEKFYRDAMLEPLTDPLTSKFFPPLTNARIGDLRIRQGDIAGGVSLLHSSEQVLRSEPGPPIEIVPTLLGLAFGARVRGDYSEGQKYAQEAVDLLAARPTSYYGSEQFQMELAANQALQGNPQALPLARGAWQRLQAGPSLCAVERHRFLLIMGIVEAHVGSPEAAAQNLKSALTISEQEVPKQPADRVEIFLRLAQLQAAQGRNPEAAETARKGLQTAEQSYGSFFEKHPFVAALRGIATKQ